MYHSLIHNYLKITLYSIWVWEGARKMSNTNWTLNVRHLSIFFFVTAHFSLILYNVQLFSELYFLLTNYFFSVPIQLSFSHTHSPTVSVAGSERACKTLFLKSTRPGVSNSEWPAGLMRLKERSGRPHIKSEKNYLQIFSSKLTIVEIVYELKKLQNF